ncbi:hypothetical protein SBA1_300015 [Candidatus Sulfotelmatobacter kueseliae]|uniref:Uncharacterized protein n=1 Tax=Candidatus Sulfotelmatobacter kueseliae TaxID=2042962 RepID=A0A2U3KLE8_9BACT|nr:hypothetical protein SBA1_300015 [Candidatus Sulfotelmatobacter kueseliae]
MTFRDAVTPRTVVHITPVTRRKDTFGTFLALVADATVHVQKANGELAQKSSCESTVITCQSRLCC